MKFDKNTDFTELNNPGERLTYLRVYYGYSQSDIAQILGITQGTVSRYEVETRPIPLEIMEKLSVLYKVPLSFIEDGLEKPPLKDFKWISPEDIIQLSNFIQSLKYLNEKVIK